MSRSIAAVLALSFCVLGVNFAFAISPAEIAAASRARAEKHETCRLEVKQQKLSVLKQRAYMKACLKR